MARFTTLLAGLSVAALAASCGPAEPATDAEGPAGVLEGAIDLGTADALHYAVRRDARTCLFPLCGGYFVRSVNHALTACADGQLRPECYAAAADFAALRLTPEDAAAFEDRLVGGLAIARATLRPSRDAGLFGLGQLTVVEGWSAATRAEPVGTFYRLARIPRLCPGASARCPSLAEAELDGPARRVISAVDLGASGASSSAVAEATVELRRASVLVAGTHEVSPAVFPAVPRRTLVAAQFYLRVPEGSAPIPCGGILWRPCPAGLACDLTVLEACNGADLPGVCKPVPDVCIQLYEPVCGCDGATYGNDCVRRMAGVQKDHEGACGSGHGGE